MTYKGCKIEFDAKLGCYIWDEPVYGMQSEGFLATVEDAKADIDLYFNDAPPPRVINNEIEWF